jgi:hypothetical protein
LEYQNVADLTAFLETLETEIVPLGFCSRAGFNEWKKFTLFRRIALMMEAAGTTETSVNFYQTAWRNIPEDSHLQ